MLFLNTVIVSLMALVLISCGGGSGSSDSEIDLDLGLDLDLEEHIMRYEDEDANYVGTLVPQDIEYLAEKNGSILFEANIIPMQPQCQWRVYTEDGAFFDMYDGSPKEIHFDEGGRLSGGFKVFGSGASGAGGEYFHRSFYLIDTDTRERIGSNRMGNIELRTNSSLGSVISVNETTVGYVDKVIRIVGGFRGGCHIKEWS